MSTTASDPVVFGRKPRAEQQKPAAADSAASAMRAAVNNYKTAYSEEVEPAAPEPVTAPSPWPLTFTAERQALPDLPDPAGFTRTETIEVAASVPPADGLFVLAGPSAGEPALELISDAGATVVRLPFDPSNDTTHLLAGAAAIAATLRAPSGKE